MTTNARAKLIITALAAVLVAGVATLAPAAHEAGAPLHTQGSGWNLPPEARTTTNPLKVDDSIIAAGRKLFTEKCQKCHGPTGLGDGPDADPEHAESMNLTNPARADRNPDGIVFYKVSNGRRSPRMPAFKEELSPEQIWSIVAYVQTLRVKK